MSRIKHIRLIQKLKEQYEFINRSSEAFDQGHQSEALRIATNLRVIFHQTRNSESIINQLNLGKKQMLSSARGWGDHRD